jgi:hypothetical protein
MTTELRITGTVESLNLQPGDKIIVTLEDRNIRSEHVKRIHEQCKTYFPNHDIIILSNGLRITKADA